MDEKTLERLIESAKLTGRIDILIEMRDWLQEKINAAERENVQEKINAAERENERLRSQLK